MTTSTLHFLYSHPSYGTKNFLSTARSVVIGRQKAELDLTPDLQVSQLHARITQEDGVWWIEDLGSLNGTLVNGSEIEKQTRMTASDRVTIGETTLQIQAEQEDSGKHGTRFGTVRAIEPTAIQDGPANAATASAIDNARKRLSVFYELGAAFASTDNIDVLLTKLVQQVLRAMPMAQRGALLLREQSGQLLLKAHFPEGQPSPSLSLAQQAIENKEAFIWRRDQAQAKVSGSIMRSETQCALYAPLVLRDEVLGVIHVDSCIDAKAFNDEDLYLLMALSYQAAMVVKFQSTLKALRDEASIRSDMMRWFSPKIAKRLASRGNLWSGGERVQATILCSDIRGFTTLTMNMEPNHVVKALNETFELLIPIIIKYDGTVDKYVGDSILAIFGTPEADANQWEHAVCAAVEMQAAMNDLASVWRLKGREPFEIGIGIHTGEILHGIVGAHDRMEFTIIGDAVNRAVRFCDGAGKGEVVISKEVYEHVFRVVDVAGKTIITKHPTAEGNLQGYLVRGLKRDL
jgi:adenylate cyclase